MKLVRMKLARRLVILFALVGLFGVGVTAYLSYRVTTQQVQRFFEREDERGEYGEGEAHEDEAREGRGPHGPRFASAPGRQQLLQDLTIANLEAALIALGVSLAAGSLFAYRFTRPIATLTSTARRYGAGERTLRAPLVGDDELTELARVFNHTTDQLQLEQKQQQRLIADVAHELRTPLTILSSELEAMQDGLMEATPENLAQLKGQADLLSRLVQDLRFLTLAEAGELELLAAPVNLADLIAETVTAFNALANAKDVRLSTRLEPLTLHADADRLKQALFNLLSNALRHSPEEGEVGLELSRTPHHARITISDQGPGIPPEHLPYVFEQFYRADKARSRAGGGSGLGLAIVEAIVVLHGGEVSAENQARGGARFVVRLPVTPF